MDESILQSIKKMLGIDASYTHFDSDIMIHINSVIMILRQMGVGPSDAFYIEDGDTTWEEFIDEPYYESVKTLVYLRVRNMFDPPASSTVLEASNKIISELEWRLYVESQNRNELS